IVGESPEQVLRCLVRDGRRMTFLPAPDAEPARALPPSPSVFGGRGAGSEGASAGVSAQDPLNLTLSPTARGRWDQSPGVQPAATPHPDLLPNDQPRPADDPLPPPPAPSSADQSDHKLQTSLPAESLQERLLKIYYGARASVEEQGVNTLFLAL